MTRPRRYDDAEIREALVAESNGESLIDICSRLGISERTFYRWKNRIRTEISPELVDELEEEIRLLRRQLQRKEDEIHILIRTLAGEFASLAERRSLAQKLIDDSGVSERKACNMVGINRSSKRYGENRLEDGQRSN